MSADHNKERDWAAIAAFVTVMAIVLPLLAAFIGGLRAFFGG